MNLSSYLVDIAPSGYQYPPVLTERDLLNVQTPNYCANIFKNSVEDILVFVNSSQQVCYSFKTVADVNAFLFEVTSQKKLRTLGNLKENSKNLVLQPREGYFVLKASVDNSLAEEKHQSQFSSANNSKLEELKFEDKLEMFKFLISQQGKELRVLAFDPSQILNTNEDSISVNLRGS